MYAKLKMFRQNEDGAVTVDWVVLTAAIVGIAVAVVATIRTGVNTSASKIVHVMDDQDVGGSLLP